MLLTLLFSIACNSETTQAAPTRTITLAAYTTPREAYGKAILPAFTQHWKEKTGEDIKFEESYQASGAQARAVKEGFEADIVALSLEPDIKVLEDAGLITQDWRTTPHSGMVTQSLAVIAVRPGNPKKIADWTDLTRSDVEVLTPNVRTSGGAMWNVLAIWGAGIRGHSGVKPGDELGASGLLRGVLTRVKVMDKGARESIVNFEKGIGDAAITYENEVLVAQKEGQLIEYIIPPATILIENPVAIVDSYAKKHGNEDIAQAFITFLHSEAAQKAFIEYGLRPVEQSLTPSTLPQPPQLFTIQDLGGWASIKIKVFEKGGIYDQAIPEAK